MVVVELGGRYLYLSVMYLPTYLSLQIRTLTATTAKIWRSLPETKCDNGDSVGIPSTYDGTVEGCQQSCEDHAIKCTVVVYRNGSNSDDGTCVLYKECDSRQGAVQSTTYYGYVKGSFVVMAPLLCTCNTHTQRV